MNTMRRRMNTITMCHSDRLSGPPRLTEDVFNLICAPVVEGEDHIDGCIVEHCSRCNCEVWRSPSSQPYRQAVIICIPCFLLDDQAAKARGETIEPQILPGAREELLDHFRKRGH